MFLNAIKEIKHDCILRLHFYTKTKLSHEYYNACRSTEDRNQMSIFPGYKKYIIGLQYGK